MTSNQEQQLRKWLGRLGPPIYISGVVLFVIGLFQPQTDPLVYFGWFLFFFGVLASGDGEPLVGPFKHWLEKRAKNPPPEKPSPTPEETLKAALDRPPSLNKWLSRLGPLVIICGAVLIYHGIFPHRSDGYIFLGCLIALALRAF